MADLGSTILSSAANVSTVGLGLAVCSIVGVVIHRLFFHPLAKYPGPLLGRLTDWYSVYHAAKGDRHLDFLRLHRKYGKVVRFGPNRISVNSAEGLKAIYGTHANTQKSSFYSVFNHFFEVPSTETAIDKHQHARKRRALSKALSEKFLKESEHVFVDNYQLLDNRIMAENCTNDWSEGKDTAELFGYYAFDVMGGICFGKSFDTLRNSENTAIMDTLSDGAQALNCVGHMPSLLKLGLERLVLPKLLNGLDFYKEYSQKVADSCIRERRISVATELLPDHDDPKDDALSYAELVAEVSVLVIAGSDTTAATLANALFHLLYNEASMKSLKEEIDATFATDADIVAGRQLAACSYLYACITEALRLSPPVGGLLAREVLPGGISTDGIILPEGTDVGTSAYALQHSEEHYPDPWKFDPSRWLRADELAQSAFCAFSLGPRGCVGKRMAYAELTLVLARLVWQYDMRLSGGLESPTAEDAVVATKKRDAETIDKFTGQTRGPFVQFRRRSR